MALITDPPRKRSNPWDEINAASTGTAPAAPPVAPSQPARRVNPWDEINAATAPKPSAPAAPTGTPAASGLGLKTLTKIASGNAATAFTLRPTTLSAMDRLEASLPADSPIRQAGMLPTERDAGLSAGDRAEQARQTREATQASKDLSHPQSFMTGTAEALLGGSEAGRTVLSIVNQGADVFGLESNFNENATSARQQAFAPQTPAGEFISNVAGGGVRSAAELGLTALTGASAPVVFGGSTALSQIAPLVTGKETLGRAAINTGIGTAAGYVFPLLGKIPSVAGRIAGAAGLGAAQTTVQAGSEGRIPSATELAEGAVGTGIFQGVGEMQGHGAASAQPTHQQASSMLDHVVHSIVGQESGGNYSATNVSKNGTALGKYQVMDYNLSKFLKQANLPDMTPEAYLASPDVQDALGRSLIERNLTRNLQKTNGDVDAAVRLTAIDHYGDMQAKAKGNPKRLDLHPNNDPNQPTPNEYADQVLGRYRNGAANVIADATSAAPIDRATSENQHPPTGDRPQAATEAPAAPEASAVPEVKPMTNFDRIMAKVIQSTDNEPTINTRELIGDEQHPATPFQPARIEATDFYSGGPNESIRPNDRTEPIAVPGRADEGSDRAQHQGNDGRVSSEREDRTDYTDGPGTRGADREGHRGDEGLRQGGARADEAGSGEIRPSDVQRPSPALRGDERPAAATHESQSPSISKEQGVPVAHESGAVAASEVPTKEIEVAPREWGFQGRDDKFSQTTVDNIKAGYSELKMNPIKVWKDPDTGKLYTGNHSRLEAFRQLADEGSKRHETIPTQIYDMPRKEFADYARQWSNVTGTAETPMERAGTYRAAREKGEPISATDRRRAEGKNAEMIDALSYLDPKSKAAQDLSLVGKGGDTQSTGTMATIAEWTGAAARDNPELTRSHQNEIYDFLRENYGKGGARNKTELRDRVQAAVQRQSDLEGFHADKPLNMEGARHKSEGEREVERKINEAEANLADARDARQKKITEFNDRIDKAPTNEQADLRKRADAALSKYDAAIELANNELVKLRKDRADELGKVRRSELSMFDTEPIEDTHSPLGKEAVHATLTGATEQHVVTEERIATTDGRGELENDRTRRTRELIETSEAVVAAKEAAVTAEVESAATTPRTVRTIEQAEGNVDRLLVKTERAIAEATKPNKRPALVVVNEKSLPTPKEHVPQGKYDIAEDQRFAVNLALDRFDPTSDRHGPAFMMADGTGVGKTRQLLVIAQEHAERSGKPSLIVTQSKAIIEGSFTDDARALGLSLRGKNIMVTTYSGLKTKGFEPMLDTKFGVVLFDEAHNLKNAESGKSQVAASLKTDHKLFATATPMDRVDAGVYFLSEVTGEDPEAIYKKIGMTLTTVTKYTASGKPYEVTYPVMQKGVTPETVKEALLQIRNDAMKEGAFIRREYPFYGEVKKVHVSLSTADMRAIREADDIASAKYDNPRVRMAQSLMLMGRVTEERKAPHVMERIKSELAEGRSVIVAAEGLKGGKTAETLGGDYEPLIAKLRDMLKAEGIPISEVHGDAEDRPGQIASFQRGDNRVLLMTAKSGGAGINLDDTVGDRPRTLILATADFSGDVFDQILGRVSRRNTASPAHVVLLMSDSPSDLHRNLILTKKLRVLTMVQHGADPDVADMSQASNTAWGVVSDNGAAGRPYHYTDEESKPIYSGSEQTGVFSRDLTEFEARQIYPQTWNTPDVGWFIPKHRIKPTSERPVFGSDVEEGAAVESEKAYAPRRDLAPGATQRVEIDPITGGKLVPPAEKIRDLEQAIKRHIPQARIRYGSAGEYNIGTGQMRLRWTGDLDTTAHELGHSFDADYGLTKQWDKALDAELDPFAQTGTPSTNATTRRKEGIAEYLRAWMVNPLEAELRAPQTVIYMRDHLPADVLKTMREFGDSVREHAGQSGMEMTESQIQMDEAKRPISVHIKEAFKGKGMPFEITKWDLAHREIRDEMWPAYKAIRQAIEWRGGVDRGEGGVQPEHNPEVLLRLLPGGAERYTREVLEHGQLDPRGERYAETYSANELLEPLDAANLKKELSQAAAVMVSQRVVEKGDILMRKAQDAANELRADGNTEEAEAVIRRAEMETQRLSGQGAGIASDYATSKATIKEFNGWKADDPEKHARITEAIRRYRVNADNNLRYLVERGRLSQEQYDIIKSENDQYVSMQRIMDENNLGGNAKGADGLRRFKGSTRTIDNPWVSLLDQTYHLTASADRNWAMRQFRDLLAAPSDTGAPYAEIAYKVDAPGKLTIPIWVDGTQEHWAFHDPYLHRALSEFPHGKDESSLLLTALQMPARILRSGVVHAPPFLLRNLIRDTQERSLVSGVGSRPLDIFRKQTPESLGRFYTAGGGLAGFYGGASGDFHNAVKQIVREHTGEDKVLATLSTVRRGIDRFYESNEVRGRMAEFNKATTYAKDVLGYDDYNADLYGALQARDLLDFAVAGRTIRQINKYIPFTNAAVQGLSKTLRSARENPKAFALRMAVYAVLPTLAEYAYNVMGGDEDEYRKLPAYKRDFYYNMKVGSNTWIAIPKPWILGVLSTGVTRTIDRVRGNENAFEGYTGNVAQALLPIDESAMAGPMKSFFEAKSGYDSFRDKYTVPPSDLGVDVRLRKGTEHASRIGKFVQSVVGADGRQIDQFIQSTTGSTGALTLALSDIGREDRPGFGAAMAASGVVRQSSAWDNTDVQFVMKTAQQYRMSESKEVVALRDAIHANQTSTSQTEREATAKTVRTMASALRTELTDHADAHLIKAMSADNILSAYESASPKRRGGMREVMDSKLRRAANAPGLSASERTRLLARRQAAVTLPYITATGQ